MDFVQNIVVFLLIFSLVAGAVGIFCLKSDAKKISCLSACYINLIITLVIFSKNSEKASQLFSIITTALILFSITLALGFCIILRQKNNDGE
jgi:hypothetical protein